MRRVVPLLLLVLVACPKPPPPQKIVEETPPDPKSEAGAVLKAAYAALEASEPERLVELLAADAMVFGLGPSDTFNYRDPLIERLKQELMPLGLRGDTMKIESDARVGIADGGRSAWMVDLPRVVFSHQGEETVWLPRITAHATLDGTHWRIDALHLSLAVADDDFYAADALKRFTSPTEVANERGPDSDQLIGVTRRMQEAPGVKLDRISGRDDVFLVGSAPTDVYPGQQLLDLRPRIAELRKAYVAPKLDGPLRARLAPDGKTGWAAGIVITRHPTTKKTLPALRALWVFAEEKGFWNIVGEHMSVALKTDQRTPSTPAELKAPPTLPTPKKRKKYEDSDGTTYW